MKEVNGDGSDAHWCTTTQLNLDTTTRSSQRQTRGPVKAGLSLDVSYTSGLSSLNQSE